MDKRTRERLLGRWGRWASEHWGKTMLMGLAVTIIMSLGLANLKMEMTFFSIMPGSSSQVRDLRRIKDEFPFASAITVVVDGRHISDPTEAERRVKEAVDLIAEELEKEEFAPYVDLVSGKADLDYFREHGLILSDPEDRERFDRLFSDLNLVPLLTGLNDDFEREYSGNEDNLEDDESHAVSQFAGLGELLSLWERSASGGQPTEEEISQALDAFLLGETYYLSRDNRMALLIVQPTFTMEDLAMLVPGVTAVEDAAKEIARANGLEAGITGITAIGRDEMVTSEQGLVGSMTVALILILLLMIFVFRMVSTPVITGVPLVLGIYWAMGMTGFTVHRLNIMTAMYMVALIGLGIDYAIHLLVTYTQERDGGAEFYDAMERAFSKSGAGVLIGALTTAIAFFSLQAAETELMRELGMVAGLGIIFELAAMILLIPAMMGFRHWRYQKKGKTESELFRKVRIRSDLAGGLGKRVVGRPLFYTAVSLVVILLLATQAGKVRIEDNLLNMEAKGLETVELQDTLVEEFEMGAEGLMILSDSLEEIKNLEKRLKKLDSVKRVESVAPLLPTVGEFRERVAGVEAFKAQVARAAAGDRVDALSLADELIRLEMNLLEMADMAYLERMEKMLNTLNGVTGRNDEGAKTEETSLDRLISLLESGDREAEKNLVAFQQRMVPLLREKLMLMASSQPVTKEMLPRVYRDSYISRESGEFLLTIIPTSNPWVGDFREIYTAQIASVTDKAAGMILATDQMTIMAEKDGIRAGIAALIVIFIVLLLDFRNLKLTLMTMLPLGFSFVALFGFMGLTGIKFDFINIIAVPLLIGIGVDDAVHISHRYLLEGKGRMAEVVAKTGSAVLMTTVTTVIAFASFIPSVMRAMRSTGIVLSIAMTFAFLFSIILFPAVLTLMIERTGLTIAPWGKEAPKGDNS